MKNIFKYDDGSTREENIDDIYNSDVYYVEITNKEVEHLVWKGLLWGVGIGIGFTVLLATGIFLISGELIIVH